MTTEQEYRETQVIESGLKPPCGGCQMSNADNQFGKCNTWASCKKFLNFDQAIR